MRPFETSAEFFFSLFLASHYLKTKTLAKVLLLRYNPIHDTRLYALPIHEISFGPLISKGIFK